MNAKKSRILFAVGAAVLAGVVWGVAHGSQLIGDGNNAGIAWIAGSLVTAALGVFLSYKLRK